MFSLQPILPRFPALITRCEVDYVSQWPTQSLQAIAQEALDNSSVPEEARAALITACSSLHAYMSEDLAKTYSRQYRRLVHYPGQTYLMLLDMLVQCYSQSAAQLEKEIKREEHQLQV